MSKRFIGSRQTTLAREVELSGTGVHSGAPVALVLHPADADTGYRFLVNKRGRIIAEIPAAVRYVKNLTLCTVLGDDNGDSRRSNAAQERGKRPRTAGGGGDQDDFGGFHRVARANGRGGGFCSRTLKRPPGRVSVERIVERAGNSTHVEDAIGPAGNHWNLARERNRRLARFPQRDQERPPCMPDERIVQQVTVSFRQQGVVDDGQIDRAIGQEAHGLLRGGGFHRNKPALAPAQLLHQPHAQKGRW